MLCLVPVLRGCVCCYVKRLNTHLCERASLVAEDVLDLSQFFAEGGCSGACWSVILLIVHLSVPVNPPTVTEADHLNTKNKKHAGFPSAI